MGDQQLSTICQEDIWKSLQRRYRLTTEKVNVGDREFELVKPESIDDLLDEADREGQERLPYWAEIWASGRVLAECLARSDGQRQTLLEIGCGLGLVALVAGAANFDVVASDYHEQALSFTVLNALRNGRGRPATRLLDWRALPETGATELATFDLVVGADVLYEQPNGPLVINVLDRFLKPDGLAIIADPGRRWAAEFPALCARHGFNVERVARVTTVDGSTRPTVDVYEIRRHHGFLCQPAE
jgi:predicted nicotinamide N-methyase